MRGAEWPQVGDIFCTFTAAQWRVTGIQGDIVEAEYVFGSATYAPGKRRTFSLLGIQGSYCPQPTRDKVKARSALRDKR